MTEEEALQELRELVDLLEEVESGENLSPENLLDTEKLFPEFIEIMWKKAVHSISYDLKKHSEFKNKKALRELVKSFSSDSKLSKTLRELKTKHKDFEGRHVAYHEAFCDNLKESDYFDKNPDAAIGAKMYVLWLLYSNPKKTEKEESLSQLIAYGEQMIEVFQEIVDTKKQYSTTPILTRAKNYISSGIQTILRPFREMYKWATSGMEESKVKNIEEKKEETKASVAAQKMGAAGNGEKVRPLDIKKERKKRTAKSTFHDRMC